VAANGLMASDPPITTPSEALVDLAAWLRELGWSAMRDREHLQDNYSIARQRLSTGFTITRKRKRSIPTYLVDSSGAPLLVSAADTFSEVASLASATAQTGARLS
jgi:hypothetical protein